LTTVPELPPNSLLAHVSSFPFLGRFAWFLMKGKVCALVSRLRPLCVPNLGSQEHFSPLFPFVSLRRTDAFFSSFGLQENDVKRSIDPPFFRTRSFGPIFFQSPPDLFPLPYLFVIERTSIFPLPRTSPLPFPLYPSDLSHS